MIVNIIPIYNCVRKLLLELVKLEFYDKSDCCAIDRSEGKERTKHERIEEENGGERGKRIILEAKILGNLSRIARAIRNCRRHV